jgi:hemolysin D
MLSHTVYGHSAQLFQRRHPRRTRGLVCTARIKLHQSHINIGQRRIALIPGMPAPDPDPGPVQAEIRTPERRVIQYLLSPIMVRLDEAGRER